jgi:hypothetical protein
MLWCGPTMVDCAWFAVTRLVFVQRGPVRREDEMSRYTVAKREDGLDYMAEYPGFGEMRSFTEVLNCEAVAFTWREMPEGTGWSKELRPQPQDPGGGLLRQRREGHIQGRRRRLRC